MRIFKSHIVPDANAKRTVLQPTNSTAADTGRLQARHQVDLGSCAMLIAVPAAPERRPGAVGVSSAPTL